MASEEDRWIAEILKELAKFHWHAMTAEPQTLAFLEKPLPSDHTQGGQL